MHCAMMQHMTAVGHRHVCPTLTNRLVNPEPSDASTDRQGTLGIDPRAGTNFVLGPLSDRILISGVCIYGQYIQCKRHLPSNSIINLTENKINKRIVTLKANTNFLLGRS